MTATTSDSRSETELPVIPAAREARCPLAPPPEFAQWRDEPGLRRAIWGGLPVWSVSRYQDIRAGQVALLTSADGGALLRVIAGEIDGHPGPGVTHTPIALVHVTISPGAMAIDMPNSTWLRP